MQKSWRHADSFIVKLAVATFISMAVFAAITLISYLIYLKPESDFSLGLPWIYYSQNLKNNVLYWESSGLNFILDAALTWMLCVKVYFSLASGRS